MNAHVRNPLISSGPRWSGPRPRRGRGHPEFIEAPVRKLDPNDRRYGFTATDAILYALDAMGGEGTCKEVEDYVRAHQHVIPIPTKQKAEISLRHGVFSSYYGRCYLDWNFTDEIGVRLYSPGGSKRVSYHQVHRINDEGRKFLAERMAGAMPRQIAADLFSHLEQTQDAKADNEKSKLLIEEHKRRLREELEAAQDLAGSVVPKHLITFDRKHPLPFGKWHKRLLIWPDSLRHPYHAVFVEQQAKAAEKGLSLRLESGYAADPNEPGILYVHVERLSTAEPLHKNREAVHTKTEHSVRDCAPEMLRSKPDYTAQTEFPGMSLEPIDHTLYRNRKVEQARIGRETFQRYCGLLRTRLHEVWKDTRRFTYDDIPLDLAPTKISLDGIPCDINHPQNPYYPAVKTILEDAEKLGFTLVVEQASNGFTVAFD